jgi:hypothetical protein
MKDGTDFDDSVLVDITIIIFKKTIFDNGNQYYPITKKDRHDRFNSRYK